MTESQLQREIKKALKKRGCYAVKYHGSAYSEKGVSDLLGCRYDGKMFALEVKLPTKRDTVTKLQQYQLDLASQAGAITGVVCSIEEAIDVVFHE